MKIDKGQVFRCDVRPGSYTLRVNAQPWGESGDLVLDGAEPGPLRLKFTKGDGETLAQPVTVKGQFVTLTGTYQHLLRWMVLVETPRIEPGGSH